MKDNHDWPQNKKLPLEDFDIIVNEYQCSKANKLF